jgi:hypothetical protein
MKLRKDSWVLGETYSEEMANLFGKMQGRLAKEQI